MNQNRERPPKRLRIAICIWMFKPGTGGLQAHAQNLAKHLIESGHEVTVLTRAYTAVPSGLGFLDFQESETTGEVEGIPVRAIHYTHTMGLLAKLIAKLREYPVLWRFGVTIFRWSARSTRSNFAEFDVIHYVGQADQLFGFSAADGAAFHKISFIAQPTCHPFVVGDSPIDIALYQRADRVLVHTRYEAEHLSPFLPSVPIDVVGNGIEDRSDGDGERFRIDHKISGPMVLFLGRRDHDKGYPLMVEAFGLLRQNRQDVTLVCMGPAGEIPITNDTGIIYFDFTDEQTKHDALAACTCLCVPSEGESFGLVYMEAGRYTKPVIARRLPVMEELLDAGSAGLLVGTMIPESNTNKISGQELSDAITRLLDDRVFANEIGEACREVSEGFIWPRIVERFISSYSAAQGVQPKTMEIQS